MPANISYTSISLSTVLGKESSGGVWKTITTPITLNDDSKIYRCSLSSASNKLIINFTTDTALSFWQVYCTKVDDEHGPNIGTCWYQTTNIAKNSSKTITISLTASNFNSGEAAYRIGLYGKSQEDGCWDITELFMVYDMSSAAYVSYVPTDYDAFEVQSSEEAD